MIDYLNAFKSELAPLVSSGAVRFVEERSEPAHFGDAMLLAEGPRVRIRLTADRGQLFVDVSAPSWPASRWLPLRPLLQHLAGTSTIFAGSWRSAADLGNDLRGNMATLEALLNSGDPVLGQIPEAP